MAAVAFSEWTDEDLLAEWVSKKSEAAYTALHSRYDRWLRGSLRKRFRLDDDSLDDVCQNAWLQLLKSPGGDGTHFGKRLFGQAKFQVLTWFYNRRRWNRQGADDALPFAADNRATEPLDVLIAKEEVAAVRTALDQLQPEERAILESYCVDESSRVESGGRSRVDRALKAFLEVFLPKSSCYDADQELRRKLRLGPRFTADAEAADLVESAWKQVDPVVARKTFGESLPKIKRLKPAIQAAAVLRYIGGQSFAAIAAKLDVHRMTVIRQLREVRALMPVTTAAVVAESTVKKILKKLGRRKKPGIDLKAVVRLPVGTQAAVLLRATERMTLEQIADRLQTTRAAVKRRLDRARAAMQSSPATAA